MVWCGAVQRERSGPPMRPRPGHPPVEPSPAEQAILQRIKRAKLFVFLRRQRHVLFDAAFQAELASCFADSPFGQPPVPPAQLALATVLQAYVGCSDDEVLEATVLDRRRQLVLDCLDAERPPFSKGTLVAFRQWLLAHDLDRRLLERTIDVAAQTGGFSPRALRAALDSSPLWGAARVEATSNRLGHALRKALAVIARPQGRGLADLAAAAGAAVVAGSSLKAALDRDWDGPAERQAALAVVLGAVEAVERWLASGPRGGEDPRVAGYLAVAAPVRAQDVETGPEGPPRLRTGVAPARRIAVEDPAMRHGRKSRRQRFDGYKRHAVRDLDRGLVRAVGGTPANRPDAEATAALEADLAHQAAAVSEWHLDRGYLSSPLVRERRPDVAIYCKAWPVRNGGRFPKTAFALDWARRVIRCPNAVELPFEPGGTVQFPAATCAACPLRARCPGSPHGRSVAIHPDERLLAQLRQRQATPAGRAQLRERVAVEHSLAHLGRWQGPRARYRGLRKNLFDLRRCAVVHTLHVIARLPELTQATVA